MENMMPPKVRVTKKMILDAAFDIVRKEGYESLNARRIAECLGCSTQPVLYNFKSVDEIREETYRIADEYHTGYIMPGEKTNTDPLLFLGLNYIRFGYEEKHLFRFLFQTNQFGGMDMNTLMNNPELAAIIGIVAKSIDCNETDARELFLTFFVVAHGYASLMANNTMEYDEKQSEKILKTVFCGMLSSLKGQQNDEVL